MPTYYLEQIDRPDFAQLWNTAYEVVGYFVTAESEAGARKQVSAFDTTSNNGQWLDAEIASCQLVEDMTAFTDQASRDRNVK